MRIGNAVIDQYRKPHPLIGSSPNGSNYGFFQIPSKFRRNVVLSVISSGSGYRWEHVSVSTLASCPTWEEMNWIKELFWSDDETVFQFHPEKSKYINRHQFCLHLWLDTRSRIELPPLELI